jgi:hypothetical protein
MGRRARNRIELVCWLGIAADLLVVITSRPRTPSAAQASSISKTPTAVVAPQRCQPVIDQIVDIASDESARANPNEGPPLAAIDQCVQRQEQIDITGCPADFRTAESRFLFAEQSLCRDAHEDLWSDRDVVQRAFFDVYAQRSPYDTLDQISNKIKHDLDVFQSAAFDLNQVSAGHGVN